MPSPSNPKPNGAVVGAELRADLRGEPVLITPGRAARPYDMRESAEERRRRCPFCEGRESQTPPEVAAGRGADSTPDGPGWSWRVAPNRYPAMPREPAAAGGAFGVHEVIIETPDHERGLADLEPEALRGVLGAWQQRLRAAAKDERLQYGNVFKNHGLEAGASLEHAHSQLMAIPTLPQRAAAELEAFRDGSAGRRLETDLANPELAVASAPGYRAFAPAAARFPDEVWILAEQPAPAFEEAGDLASLASLVRRVLGAMNALHDRPSYHLLVATAPFRAPGREHWRWRLEIFPRLTKIGGFEWASGMFVNQRDPVEAAGRYRAALKPRP